MLVLKLGRAPVEALAFGPDGRTLVVPFASSGLLIWSDVTAGGEPRALPALDAKYWLHGPVRVSDDGRRVACRTQDIPVVYDTAGGGPFRITRSRPKAPDYSNAAITG